MTASYQEFPGNWRLLKKKTSSADNVQIALPMYIYVTSGPEVFGLYKETHVKSRTCRSLTKINNLAVINSWKGCSIALIHDTRYLCTPFIKTMSRGISGTNKWYNLPIRAIAFEFVYFLKTRERLNSRAKCTVRVSTSCTSLLLSGGHSWSLLHLKT